MIFETFISEGACNGMIVRFRGCPPPVRRHEEIGAVVAVAWHVESIIRLTRGWSGNAEGRTTWGVEVFDRYVAARCDAKYGSRTGEQQQNDGNDSPHIAHESTSQLPDITHPISYPIAI